MTLYEYKVFNFNYVFYVRRGHLNGKFVDLINPYLELTQKITPFVISTMF